MPFFLEVLRQGMVLLIDYSTHRLFVELIANFVPTVLGCKLRLARGALLPRKLGGKSIR